MMTHKMPPTNDIPAPPYPGFTAHPPAGNYWPGPAPYPVSTQPPVFIVTQQSSPAPQAVVPQVVMVQHRPTAFPGRMMCPHCQTDVLTKTRPKMGKKAWTICACLGVFLIWPFCLIPFCVDSCQDVEHSCTLCGNVLHVHKRR